MRRLRLVTDDLVAAIPDFAFAGGEVGSKSWTDAEADAAKRQLAANKGKTFRELLRHARQIDGDLRARFKADPKLAEEYSEDDWVEDEVDGTDQKLWSTLTEVCNQWAMAPAKNEDAPTDAPALPRSQDLEQAKVDKWIVDQIVAIGSLIARFRTKNDEGWRETANALARKLGTAIYNSDDFGWRIWKHANKDRRLIKGKPFDAGLNEALLIEEMYLKEVAGLDDSAEQIKAKIETSPTYLQFSPPKRRIRKRVPKSAPKDR